MKATYVARFDSMCGDCREGISEGDEITFDRDGRPYHADCQTPATNIKTVEWRTAETIARSELEDIEEARVAPLGKQGKCPVCFIELPLSRICDDHGPMKV